MGKIMVNKPQKKILKIFGGIFLSLTIITFFGLSLISNIWIERRELLGLSLGISKQKALSLLVENGIDFVLPRQKNETVINKKNTEMLRELKDSSGLCVTSNQERVNLQIGFDKDGNVKEFHYGSVRKYPELNDIKSKEDLFSKLNLIITSYDDIEVRACIPKVRWIRITGTAENDRQPLFENDVWLFDEPNSYSGARLTFVDGRLSKIQYRWQLYEAL